MKTYSNKNRYGKNGIGYTAWYQRESDNSPACHLFIEGVIQCDSKVYSGGYFNHFNPAELSNELAKVFYSESGIPYIKLIGTSRVCKKCLENQTN